MILAAAILASSLLGDLGPAEAEPAAVETKQVETAAAAPVEPAEAKPTQPVEAKPAAAGPVEIEVSAPGGEPAAGPDGAKGAGHGKKAKKPVEKRSVKITSERTDYDRKDGVIMFDGDVFVDDAEYKMHADRIFVFLDGTNDLKRIVALGGVAITNDMRVGTCAKATYSKAASKIVMYSGGTNEPARLVDGGRRRSEVEGRKITFWVDTEQVEVEGSTVTLDAGGIGGKEGARKLLGK